MGNLPHTKPLFIHADIASGREWRGASLTRPTAGVTRWSPDYPATVTPPPGKPPRLKGQADRLPLLKRVSDLSQPRARAHRPTPLGHFATHTIVNAPGWKKEHRYTLPITIYTTDHNRWVSDCRSLTLR